MKRPWATLVATVCLTLGLVAFASAQELAAKDTDLASAIARLSAPKRADQSAAFYAIVDMGTLESDNHAWPVQLAVRRLLDAFPARRESLTVGLIALADREEKEGFSTNGVEAGDLVGAVAALRDPRALPVLLARISTGGIVERGLVALGDTAIEPVAAAAHDIADSQPQGLLRRASATRVLGAFLAPSADVTVSAAHRRLIKTTLLDALQSKDAPLRKVAVNALVNLKDDDVTKALRAQLAVEPDAGVATALKTALAGRSA